MSKEHKESSTATDVDTAHASSSKSLESVFLLGKRVLEACSEIKLNLKEQEKHKEIKSEETEELMKSIKELTTAIKQLQETLQTKPDLLEMVPLKDTQEEVDEDMDTCGFGVDEKNNGFTVFVTGFQKLRGVFGQFGVPARVFVPAECKTLVPLGFAFINFEFEICEDSLKKAKEIIDKALKLNGRLLEGRQLEVTMASKRGEYYGFTNFRGCERCCSDTTCCLRGNDVCRVSDLGEEIP